jgi:hypothetical protein
MNNNTPRLDAVCEVRGVVRLADGQPAADLEVSAVDRDLRSEHALGRSITGRDGSYSIRYDATAPSNGESGTADLVIKAHGTDGVLLAASPVLFNAPPSAVVDLTIPTAALQPLSRFEEIARAIEPLLDGATVRDLEEDAAHQDVSFLAGETGLDKSLLARFILAHRLTGEGLPAEFWFALLGGAFFEWTDGKTVAEQLAAVSRSLPSLDAVAVRKSLARGFGLGEISASFEKRVPAWVEAFTALVARRAVDSAAGPTFLGSALDHAGVRDAAKREAVAQLFLEHRALTPEVIAALEQDRTLTEAQIADVRTSFHLADLTGGGFDVVRTIKEHFSVRRPEDVPALGKQPVEEWVKLVKSREAAGELTLPVEVGAVAGRARFPAAEVYARALARQVHEAFPTMAFTGGLERALRDGEHSGIRQGKALSGFLDRHPEFDLARTTVDDFLDAQTSRADRALARDDGFRQELKAVQRVHKLAGTFETTAALLADGLHSARQIYRLGESEFVRRYGEREGFSAEDARRAWRRAADTHAAVLTIVGDLKALDAEALPKVLQHGTADLTSFPNWENLFRGGDICVCEHCNSVLSPAAYFADILMFLRDRVTLTAGKSVKDLLLERRPDLGYLELNCDNALTPLPYVDVVCEVLEAVVAASADDRELPGLTAMPADPAAARAAVASALAAAQLDPGDELSLSQVRPSDPDLWVAHGNRATYLLKKKATPNFFAEVLRNTKADAEELRAYPQYVNAKAYDTLRQARHPFALPFDLFGEEVRAAFAKSNLRRWELMQHLTSSAGPSEGEIAAEYFGIGVDGAAATDEQRLILVADASAAGQQGIWGEAGNANWLDAVSNVKTFLGKTGLEYRQLGALLDLPFIDPDDEIVIEHLDASCDVAQKVIRGLDPAKLDRIHRFLRLWRKLKGWAMWEVDLALRCAGVGAGVLDEACLINLFHLARLRTRLGTSATVAHLCALFEALSTETHFVDFFEPRAEGLYQRLFLDKRLVQPLDPALAVAAVDVPPPTAETISGHRLAILAALGLSQSDLDLLATLPSITDDLTLDNLTLLWRHAWLAKLLKLKVSEWATALELLQQNALSFADAREAWELVERIDQLRATGLTFDQLDWILTANRSARAATRESDATRFLSALRTGLGAIQTEYDPARYPFLDPPSDGDRLTGLLATLLQQLHRDAAGTQLFLDTLRDGVPLAAAVTGMPANFSFPAAIGDTIRIGYDEAAGVLRFRGLMTPAERTTLLGAPSLSAVTANPSYGAAVEELFGRPRLALKFLDPIFTAPLADLPATVDLASVSDPTLAQKVSYDAEARALRLVGILSAEDKAALDALSSDPAYRAAVDSLLTQPVTGTFDADVLWLDDADLQFPLRDPDDPPADNLNRNLATAVAKGLTHLSRSLSESLTIRQASAELGLSEALTRRLLADYAIHPDTLLALLTGPFAASSGAVDYATLQPVFDGWFWATRVAALWKKWKLTLAEWEQMRDLMAGAQLLDVATLPLTAGTSVPPTGSFLRTARLLALRDGLPESGLTLLELLANLDAGQYASPAAFAADVERVNDAWSATDVEALVGALDLVAYPNDYLLAESWERVRRVFSYARSLNAGVTTLATLAGATMGAAEAATVKGLLRSRLDAESWRALSEQIQDLLRERKRDALTAYLLSQPMPADAPTGKWENPNDLYAYYLLDVEMGACQLTSRLVQGSGSVQLLVQRCFMGLEPEVVVRADGADGDSAWKWWDWMSKYRFWEANLKVFLWPENWIEPELRRDRSPIFEELEQELLQGDVTADRAETALANYLEKLDKVAQLEIAGFYQEDDGDDTTLHVFGRTPGTDPQVHYYRQYDYRRWTPWRQVVGLDIQTNYLIPAVVNKRLFLFWPVFTEEPDPASNSTVQTPAAHENYQIKRTVTRLKMQLAGSDCRHEAWTPKKLSRDYYPSGWITGVDIVRKFYHFVPIDRTEIDGRFLVEFGGYALGSDGFEQAELHGTFEIGGCRGVPELVPVAGNYKPAIVPEWASVGQYHNPDKRYSSFMKWSELGRPDEFGHPLARHDPPQNDFTLENTFASDANARYTPVLLQTPWFFRMSPPWQLSLFDRLLLDGLTGLATARGAANPDGPRKVEFPVPMGSWLPFFYDDKKRTFFVLPVLSQSRGGGDEVAANLLLKYYPEVKHAIRQLEEQYAAQVWSFVAALDLPAFTPAQRQNLDQLLWNAFPGEAPPPLPGGPPPPYTAAEAERIRPFIQRYLMRFFHANLGALALRLFQGRRFHFKNFYHPFVCAFSKLMQNPLLGVPALMRRETQLQDSGFSFRQHYQPTPAVLDPSTEQFYPREVVDFSPDGAYSPYNWELFFHAPLLIANALSRNQRFEEARDWYHFIFNPIGVESPAPGGSTMSKYWITKPFYETTDPQYVQQRIENVLRMLAGDTTVPGFSPDARQALEEQVLDWRKHPFEPHRIASYRTVAYQKTVVMKYLDNLIAWGDNLFRQDSMESINEATQLYVLAAELLGPRPRKVPPRAKPPVETFNELESELDDLSNALVQVENLVPPQSGSDGSSGTDQPPLPMLYFCVPQNDKLLGYWDTVADRLYKIRHCMNIEGVVRQLALFEPPIDPGALVKGVAAGMDLGSILADLNAPLPLYRFQVLLQKANETCADVKALGGALLSALETRDAEALNRLRQGQEVRLLQAMRTVKAQQLDEARANLEGARRARELAERKESFYASRDFVNVGESLAMTLSTDAAAMSTAIQLGFALAGTTRTALPQYTTGGAGFGGSPVATITHGGGTLGDASEDAMQALLVVTGAMEKAASIIGTLAGYQRRRDDWDFQGDLAGVEIEQAEQAIAAAEVRVAIAEKELENHDLQIANAQEVDAFMRSRFTNLELFQWQVGQTSQVFFRSYQLAYDLARRAERCFRFELGLEDSSYITFGYWDSLKRGLMSGEKLQHDLRRLESAYLEQNRREFELTKHISLLQLDPLALVQLRETGRCFFDLSEEIFDLDYPGHYFRRIKSVSLTLPSVTGPYTTVSCTLRLLRNSIRVTSDPGSGYARNTDDSGLPIDDPRFMEHSLPVVAIAASGAQNDSGMFELNFRDERYLPFEGAGGISGWSLELFNDPTQPDFGQPLRQFDYGTITDAVLHVKYTAREDAGPLKTSAIAHLREHFSQDQAAPALLMLNLRRDFPSQWSRLLNPANPADGNVFELEMSPALFPARDAGKALTITRLWLLGRCTDPGSYAVTLTPPLPAPPPAGSNAVALNANATFGGLHLGSRDVSGDGVEVSPVGPAAIWRLRVARPGGGNLTVDPVTELPELQDLMLVLNYAWG